MMEKEGVLRRDQVVRPRPLEDSVLEDVHTAEYIKTVRQVGTEGGLMMRHRLMPCGTRRREAERAAADVLLLAVAGGWQSLTAL